MNYFIFLLFCTRYIWKINCEKEHAHGHGKVGRNNIFEEIYEHLQTTKTSDGHSLVTFHDLSTLFQDLNFRNCSKEENSTNCNLCYTVSDFLKWQKVNNSKTNLTEEEFQEISPAILYLLSAAEQKYNGSLVCKTVIEGSVVAESKDAFQKFQNKYGSTLSEESVEKLLEEINSTLGEKLTNKECFSVHDVIKGANVSEDNISEHEFEYVSGYIILKLLDKHCIKEEHEGEHNHSNFTGETVLPEPGFFADEIFEEFGTKNTSTLTHENFEAFYKKLNLGKDTTTTTTSTTTDSHAHRKRRAADDNGEEHREHAKLKKCYSAEDILKVYSVPEGSTINKEKFQEICPSLVQQLESGVCNPHVDATTTTGSSETEEEEWKPWISTMIAILIISLASLTGVFVAPISEKRWFPYLILGLIALAVSVLIGDAILHLFPHALDLHKHEEGHDHSSEEGNPLLEKESYIWKSLLFLVGVYAFFMFEVIMHSFGSGHTHSHNRKTHITRTFSNSGTNAKGALQMNEQGTVIHFNRKDSTLVQTPGGLHNCVHEDTQIGLDNFAANSASVQSLPTSNDFKYAQRKKKLTMKEFQSVAWMIIIGDAIHNFMDGVAIGAAFSEKWPSGYHGGISTSIAIFCHELPHELGDFAVLLNSGLSIKQALLMNFVSSLTAFLGGILGVVLGTQWSATPWIFAATSGLFVYIALVDMLPEILHSAILKLKPAVCIVSTNIGMLSGFVIMFLLATWEEDIKSSLK